MKAFRHSSRPNDMFSTAVVIMLHHWRDLVGAGGGGGVCRHRQHVP